MVSDASSSGVICSKIWFVWRWSRSIMSPLSTHCPPVIFSAGFQADPREPVLDDPGLLQQTPESITISHIAFLVWIADCMHEQQTTQQIRSSSRSSFSWVSAHEQRNT
ncbi:uncharacterized protein APUU_31536S [Aspergillus puulaauensis]|uniref:Uncharacterized protein n=1 Tax=Aspergillus puulaauensis TaxID=1220207 RepID=A0A7R7XKT5_9EURO|nr:uncharacterized protein APUU_31536S [Aspergillus puulaauensis]BCS23311.1 hypothetical protein APUU_31536S [Aspergillus puulaauensis]